MKYHGVRGIIIDGVRSKVRFTEYYSTDFIIEIMKGDIPNDEKQWYVRQTAPKLVFYLAGCAAEARQFGYTDTNTTDLLRRFYKSDRSPNNDIAQAMGLNIALGRQKRSDGVLGLVDVFNKTLKEVDDYWDVILWTVTQIDGDGSKEGAKLDNLIAEIKKRLEINKA